MFPQSGGSNYAQYSHGSLLGFIAAWANWVSLVTIIPIEAASRCTHQFMAMGLGKTNFCINAYVQSVRQDYSLSMSLSFFSLLNYWSVKLLTSFTSLISFFKLGVPLLTIIMLMLSGFDTNYGSSIGEFMP